LKTVAAKLYEGMFLVDSALAASDWQGVNDNIRSILEKVDAEIVSIDKWDERKLAYDIRGKSRGTYILAYFRVDGPKVAQIERSVQLSEDIIRALILCVEDVDERYITKGPQAAGTQTWASGDVKEPPEAGAVEDEEIAEVEEAETMDDEQADFSDESEKYKQQ
jgi:small subunit ribosomal protein S6